MTHNPQEDYLTGRFSPQAEQAHRKVLADVARIVPKYYPLFLRVYNGTKSRKDRERVKCLECCNLSVTEAKRCEAWSCPLWQNKPYNEKEA